MISNDTERRAPVLARHEIQADPRMLRTVLSEVEQDLEGVGGSTRRTVLLLVGALADRWSREIRDHPMILEVDRFSDHVRVEAFTDAELPVDFWRSVASAVAPGLADTWGIDRRNRRAWFEIPTSRPKTRTRRRPP